MARFRIWEAASHSNALLHCRLLVLHSQSIRIKGFAAVDALQHHP